MKTVNAEISDQSPRVLRDNSCDRNVWRAINYFNEYRLPDRFDPGTIVLDIGAHIGSFSYACLKRGATVFAFEISSENAEIYRQNMSGFDKDSWELFNRPVGGIHPVMIAAPDGNFPVMPSGEINTGGGNIFSAGETQTISLEEVFKVIIGRKPDLIKLDCEGSEFPILMTCNDLGGVGRIVGEFHCGESMFQNPVFVEAMTGAKHPAGLEGLQRHLHEQCPGYEFTYQYTDRNPHTSLGIFDWHRA